MWGREHIGVGRGFEGHQRAIELLLEAGAPRPLQPHCEGAIQK